MKAGRKLIYASERYSAHCKHWRMTAEDACEKAQLIRERMKWLGFNRKTIHLYGLDNPFAAEHARATMIAYARRAQKQFKNASRATPRRAA